jgi:excisionase family DNA binding protein
MKTIYTMKNIQEIIQFLEKNGQEQTTCEIRNYVKHLIEEHGEDADLFFLDTIERLKSFQKLLENFYELKFQQSNNDSDRSSAMTSPNNKEPRAVLKLQTRVEPTETKKETLDAPKREYGNIDFAAEILPYKKSYIREMCRKGKIPFTKPNGTFVFNRKEIEGWLSKNGQDHRDELRKIGKQVSRSAK